MKSQNGPGPGLRRSLSVAGILTLAAALATAIGVIWFPGLSSARPGAGPDVLQSPLYLPAVLKRFPLSLSGVVQDSAGPVVAAVVRVQATAVSASTDESGRFSIYGLEPSVPVTLTAWAPGYYITGGDAAYLPGTQGITLTLVAHTDHDHPDYEWLSAFSTAGHPANCQNCHSDESGLLPFDEWQLDAHALTTANVRFMTMYNGTDVYGNQSPPTEYFCSPDYGCFPLPPNPNLPYYGPGYKLDFPATAGNCAACHAPAAAIDNAYGVDPNTVSGVGAEGVACDFCHKVWMVRLNPTTGLPYDNLPGVLSFEYRRPPEDHQFFAGPFDDVAPGEDTFSPLQTQSQYCAPCHSFSFWDIPIYDSFGEWLASPYSDPYTGQTCQNCHMPPGQTTYIARPDAGGLVRDPQTIYSHRMPGALDQTLLQNAVSMEVSADRQGGLVSISVTITNDKTGHHVPTDSPLRHLILLVSASDDGGDPLERVDGPVLPPWTGEGDPDQGHYAGLPGQAYAKVLVELWTKAYPTGAYWSHTQILSDNRIAAMQSDTTDYTFVEPPAGEVQVWVRLLFRRAFIELIDQKSWDAPDILMEEEILTLSPEL